MFGSTTSLQRLVNHQPSSDTEGLEEIGTSDPDKLLILARRFLDEVGAERIMIESEGITKNFKSWRTDVISRIAKELPMDKVMFEGQSATGLYMTVPEQPCLIAADPTVFAWWAILLRQTFCSIHPRQVHPRVRSGREPVRGFPNWSVNMPEKGTSGVWYALY